MKKLNIVTLVLQLIILGIMIFTVQREKKIKALLETPTEVETVVIPYKGIRPCESWELCFENRVPLKEAVQLIIDSEKLKYIPATHQETDAKLTR